MKSIDAKTKLFAVIGNPIEHSLSPIIHNAAFKKLNLNCVYVAFKVTNLKSALAGVRALGIQGLSVTIPHKVEIIKYLDEVEEVSKSIGSVNTVINRNGRLRGLSSDGFAALKSLQEAGVDLTDKKILILGSGGAARAIAFTLIYKTKISSLTLLGIVRKELQKLSQDLKEKTKIEVNWSLFSLSILKQILKKTDILIHCTPVGMSPDVRKTLVPASYLRKELVVFDIVYNPLKTRLLSSAERKGAKTITGLEMFIHQAAIQFEEWTSLSAPFKTMKLAAQRALGK